MVVYELYELDWEDGGCVVDSITGTVGMLNPDVVVVLSVVSVMFVVVVVAFVVFIVVDATAEDNVINNALIEIIHYKIALKYRIKMGSFYPCIVNVTILFKYS